MKILKKVMCCILTISLIFAFIFPLLIVNAEGTYTVTIENAKEGHTYEIYQIFSGTLSSDGALASIEWGSGVSEEGQSSLGDAQEIADTLINEEDAKAFGNEVSPYLTTPVSTLNSTTTSIEVEPGYYLIKDEDDSLDSESGDAYTAYILQVFGNVTISPKSGAPSVSLKLKETNDSTDLETSWQDAADYDFNDEIPFKITGTIGDNYDEYSSYYFAFHAIMDGGLELNPDSIKVFVNEVETSYGFTINENPDDGCSFDITFDNLKNISSIASGSTISVEFTSILNDLAILGSSGNQTNAYLEYSNNPNDETSLGTTPSDTVRVFSYQLSFNKIDKKTSTALTGANFTLRKLNSNSEEIYKSSITADDLSTFTFTGLDAGTYQLTEDKAPDGYNSLDEPITFTISSDYEVEGDYPTLVNITGTDELSWTVNLNDGSLTASISNTKGNVLPSTGGIGTIVITATGLILMGGAGLIIIRRKKASK